MALVLTLDGACIVLLAFIINILCYTYYNIFRDVQLQLSLL